MGEGGSDEGPVAKFENGREMGRTEPHFTTAIRGQPSLKAEPIRPFLGLLTNFATGPFYACANHPGLRVAHASVSLAQIARPDGGIR